MNEDNLPLQGQYAGFLSRAVAFILDLLIIILTVVTVSLFINAILQQFLGMNINACPAPSSQIPLRFFICQAVRWGVIAFGIGFPPIYFVLFWILTGQTIGNYVMGVRVARLNSYRMRLIPAIIRYVGYLACFITLGLGFLYVLVDDRRQGLHDKLAKTCVIYSWEAKQNDRFIERAKGAIGRRLGRN